jgi:hypothetical protein
LGEGEKKKHRKEGTLSRFQVKQRERDNVRRGKREEKR